MNTKLALEILALMYSNKLPPFLLIWDKVFPGVKHPEYFNGLDAWCQDQFKMKELLFNEAVKYLTETIG